MTLVAAILAVALVATVYLFLRERRRDSVAWALERRELLNRIQRPEYIPLGTAEPFVLPDTEPDEIELVGKIQEPKE